MNLRAEPPAAPVKSVKTAAVVTCPVKEGHACAQPVRIQVVVINQSNVPYVIDAMNMTIASAVLLTTVTIRQSVKNVKSVTSTAYIVGKMDVTTRSTVRIVRCAIFTASAAVNLRAAPPAATVKSVATAEVVTRPVV